MALSLHLHHPKADLGLKTPFFLRTLTNLSVSVILTCKGIYIMRIVSRSLYYHLLSIFPLTQPIRREHQKIRTQPTKIVRPFMWAEHNHLSCSSPFPENLRETVCKTTNVTQPVSWRDPTESIPPPSLSAWEEKVQNMALQPKGRNLQTPQASINPEHPKVGCNPAQTPT